MAKVTYRKRKLFPLFASADKHRVAPIHDALKAKGFPIAGEDEAPNKSGVMLLFLYLQFHLVHAREVSDAECSECGEDMQHDRHESVRVVSRPCHFGQVVGIEPEDAVVEQSDEHHIGHDIPPSVVLVEELRHEQVVIDHIDHHHGSHIGGTLGVQPTKNVVLLEGRGKAHGAGPPFGQ